MFTELSSPTSSNILGSSILMKRLRLLCSICPFLIPLLVFYPASCEAYLPAFNTLNHSSRNGWANKYGIASSTMSATEADSNDLGNNRRRKQNALPEIKLCRKRKQKRRKMRQPRRPSCFWSNIENIESQLRSFWRELNVPISKKYPPAIPSEAILNHFERHDLRYAIANMGGREVVAKRLNGAKLVPGKWSEAVKSCKEVHYLLDPSNPAGRGLSKDIPPIAPHVKKRLESLVDVDVGDDDYEEEHLRKLRFQNGERWAHQIGRNPRGHWSEKVVIQELYDYLDMVKEERGRPSVWMPRPSELDKAGRKDLKQAIVRYGGAAKICDLAELIPYREWRYFESQLEMYIELQRYLETYHDGSEESFPKLADIKRNEQLYDLIMEFGGRKLIAAKLDMKFQAQTKMSIFQGMTFGPFSLDFAVRLMHFIRKEMLEKSAPLYNPKIQMPTQKELLKKGEIQLAMEVSKYGGHENIARRLCISFDEEESQKEAKERWAADADKGSFD